MTNEKILERLYELAKACDDNYKDFDSRTMDKAILDNSADKLANMAQVYYLPEMVFASLIADIQEDIHKESNRKTKGGIKKQTALNDILKNARKRFSWETKKWYAHDYESADGNVYQCYSDSYRLVMLAPADRLDCSPLPKSVSEEKVVSYDGCFPSVNATPIHIDTMKLRAAIKAKAPEWKAKRKKHDEKTLLVNFGEYGAYIAEWIAGMFDILGDDCEVISYGKMSPIEFRNANGSKAIVMPQNLKGLNLLSEEEIDKIETDHLRTAEYEKRNKYLARTIDGTSLVTTI